MSTGEGQGPAAEPVSCRQCGHEVPWLEFCVRCGDPLSDEQGVDALGPLGPVLHQVSVEQPEGAVFHDVVRGGNLLHSAGPGWDYSTGLGTPRVAHLARAIVDFVSR